MKQTIKLRESELKRMIAESVKRVLNEENTYTDANGDEWSDFDIECEIDFMFEHYYSLHEMSKQEVMEILQWAKDMGADGLSIISRAANKQIKFIEKCEQDLYKLYNSI